MKAYFTHFLTRAKEQFNTISSSISPFVSEKMLSVSTFISQQKDRLISGSSDLLNFLSEAKTSFTEKTTLFISQHKLRLKLGAASIGTLAISYMVGVPALISIPLSASIAALPEIKLVAEKAIASLNALKTSLKEKIVNKTVATINSISTVIKKVKNNRVLNSAIQLGALSTGMVIAYSYGVPSPILVAAPFIFAPKLLNPITQYAFMLLPLGMMANDINQSRGATQSAQYLNLGAIFGLMIGKNFIFPKIAAKVESFFAKKLQQNPVQVQQIQEDNDGTHRLACLVSNVDIQEDPRDRDYKPRRGFTPYNFRERNQQPVAVAQEIPQQVVFGTGRPVNK